jgi:pyruvate kinase
MAKLERPSSVRDHLSEIIDASDGILIARGDLGLEMRVEEVPALQKRIISECRQRHKLVVVATQMFESMVDHPRPTR